MTAHDWLESKGISSSIIFKALVTLFFLDLCFFGFVINLIPYMSDWGFAGVGVLMTLFYIVYPFYHIVTTIVYSIIARKRLVFGILILFQLAALMPVLVSSSDGFRYGWFPSVLILYSIFYLLALFFVRFAKSVSNIFILLFILLFMVGMLLFSFLGNKEFVRVNEKNNPQITSEIHKQTATKSATSAELKPVKQQIPGWLMYQSEYLSFEHPSRLKSCCGIQTAPDDTNSATMKGLITLGDVPDTELGSDRPFDGLAVSIDTNPTKLTLSKYVEKQKQGWKENFYSFLAKYPENVSENEITVGGQNGVVLKGYTWFGIDLIYVSFPDGQRILIIGRNEKDTNSFVEFSQILSTFRF